MTDLRHLSPSPELMINVRGLASNFGIDHIAATGLLTAAAVILTVAACWRAPLWRAVAAASAGSLLVAPHVYGYDAGLLLAGLWLAMFESGKQEPRAFPASRPPFCSRRFRFCWAWQDRPGPPPRRWRCSRFSPVWLA